ncbi:MAG: dihydrodipicolinate synthase family protein [Acidimicrobiales bacterium]|jgi:4-hydroxy-tetrahydrodipicolinate synthase
MARLRGVLNALVTPFTNDGEAVDEPVLRALVERATAGGVHGLVPCGSTGEFPSLTQDERRRVLEIVVDQSAGRLPVVAHTGAMTTREAVVLSRHAEQVGVAAMMLVAPYYEPLTLREVARYYREVADAVNLDVMIYNLPTATGVNLSPAEIAKLATDVPNVRYVKDTSGDFSQAACLIHDYGEVVSTFVGLDTLYLSSLLEGAAGSVLGAANLVPSELASIYDAVKAGDLEGATKMWAAVYPLMRFLVSGGYVSALKGGLEIMGWPAGVPRPPVEPLGEPRLSELRGILSSMPGLSFRPEEP